jgi:hypothetical protein
MLDRSLVRLHHRRDFLLNFFREAGLVVKQLWLL